MYNVSRSAEIYLSQIPLSVMPSIWNIFQIYVQWTIHRHPRNMFKMHFFVSRITNLTAISSKIL